MLYANLSQQLHTVKPTKKYFTGRIIKITLGEITG